MMTSFILKGNASLRGENMRKFHKEMGNYAIPVRTTLSSGLRARIAEGQLSPCEL